MTQKVVPLGRFAFLRYTNAIPVPPLLRYSRSQDPGP
jgi:hypothetical protein